MGGPPTASSCTSPSSPRASNPLHRGTDGTEVGQDGGCRDAQLRPASTPPLPLVHTKPMCHFCIPQGTTQGRHRDCQSNSASASQGDAGSSTWLSGGCQSITLEASGTKSNEGLQPSVPRVGLAFSQHSRAGCGHCWAQIPRRMQPLQEAVLDILMGSFLP